MTALQAEFMALRAEPDEFMQDDDPAELLAAGVSAAAPGRREGGPALAPFPKKLRPALS